MKKDERIALKIRADKEQMKLLEKMNKGRSSCTYDVENLINDGKDFIEATRRGTLLCVIKSVSASGMSRVMNFNSCYKMKSGRYYYRQYWVLFKALGYNESRNGNGFTIGGCGMNMVFHTHYTIIHGLHSLGFIDKKECDKLAQQTPTTF